MLRSLGYLLLFLTVLSACEGDDTSSEEINFVDLGVLKTSQIALIDQSAVNLNEASVDIEGTMIELRKLSPTSLGFIVPAGMPAGDYSFSLDAQNNLDVSFTVVDTVLSASPDSILQDLQSDLAAFEQSESPISGVATLNAYNQQLGSYIAGLNDAEKQEAAQFLQANQQLFNDILFSEDPSSVRRPDLSNLTDAQVQQRFGKFTVAAGTLSVLAYGIFVTNPIVSAVSLGLAVTGYIKAYDYLRELSERSIVTVGLAFDSVDGDFNRSALNSAKSGNIQFTDGQIKSGDLQLIGRPFIASDSSNGALSTTFGFIQSIVEMIDSLNEMITGVNDAIFFSNIPTVDNYTTATTASETEQAVTASQYGNLTFSLSDDNLNLSNLNFTNGQLSVTIEIIDPDAVGADFVEATLDYEYVNEFNDGGGSLPVRVYKQDSLNPLLQVGLEGQWRLEIVQETCTDQEIDDDLDGVIITIGSLTDTGFNQFEGSFSVPPSLIASNEQVFDNLVLVDSASDGLFQLIFYSSSLDINTQRGFDFNLYPDTQYSSINFDPATNSVVGQFTASRILPDGNGSTDFRTCQGEARLTKL